MQERRRVVVTGLGMVSPVGLSVKDAWHSVCEGVSGIAQITKFDTSGLPCCIAGELKGYTLPPCLSVKDARRMDTFIQYGISAAYEALSDACFAWDEVDRDRMGVSMGSGIGGLPAIQLAAQYYASGKKISPFFVPASIINMLPGHISILFGLKGPNYSTVTACASSAHSIGQAFRTILYGDADVMLAGGSESSVCELGVAGFSAMRALSLRNDDPERASRPWDRERDGFVLGEGAGAIVLESYEHAQARGARIYCELLGFGMSSDGYHMTAPCEDGSGQASCMRLALKDAVLAPGDIDYINAHATATALGDLSEIRAIRAVFGDEVEHLSVSSTKSMTGHLLGAAGVVEAIFSILAMRDELIPPTMNLDHPDEECVGIDLVPHTPKSAQCRYVLSNSFGFGGTNVSLVFGEHAHV